MKPSNKVAVAVAVAIVLGGGALLLQQSSSSVEPIKLTARDMEIIVSELLSERELERMASDPERKKALIKNLRTLLALAQAAEQEGYAQRADLRSQIALQSDLALREIYEKNNPGARASEEEIKAFHQSNPNAFEDFLKDNPTFQAQAQGQQREGMKRWYGETRVIADRARKEGLDKGDAARLLALIGRSQVLAQAYADDLRENSDKLVSDADIEQYYRSNQSQFEQVRARHILIRAEADQEDSAGAEAEKKRAAKREEARKKAESLLARIRAGEDFAKLASEFSEDPGSKSKGGDLDYFSRGQMVPEFEAAAFALKPGEVSQLVETQFGFHIIKVEDRRIAPLDQSTRQQIVAALKQKKFQEQLDQIVARAKVEIDENFNVTPKKKEAK
jgi:peptidyl-prolyl cis-trans isomerase C